MNADRDVLKVECTLAIARCLEADPLVCDPWSLACAVFFAGVDTAQAAPRQLAEVEAELFLIRERSAHLVPASNRFFNVAGVPHAHHRPRTDPAAPTRRKSDAEDASLASELEAEAQRARDRDRERRQRSAAHQHPWE